MILKDKSVLREPFESLYSGGVRFSTLVFAWIRFSGHRQADVAEKAGCTTRSLKSCIQGDSTPSQEVRDATCAVIGFDPWSVAADIDRRKKEQKTLRDLEQLDSDNKP